MYPELTICFDGNELRWYNDASIFDSFEVTAFKYGELLKGKNVMKYKYNYEQRMYEQIPIDIRNGSHAAFDTFSLTISEVLTGLEYIAADHKTSIHYGKGLKGKERKEIPFDVSYRTPDTICFTRKAMDSLGTTREYDWLLLNRSLFGDEMYKNVHFRMYMHHPGQLVRSLHNPVFMSNAMLGIKQNDKKVWDKIFKIKVDEVTVLRKRHDANTPCDNKLDHLDDFYVMEEIMKRVGCRPIYWNSFVGGLNFTDCKSPTDFEKIYEHIGNYKDILMSYSGPCVDMVVSSKMDKEEENEWKEPCFKILYTTKNYQDIRNTQSFGFESLLSGVGGFVGIFLGYSILQIPELLGSLMYQIRGITMRGRDT